MKIFGYNILRDEDISIIKHKSYFSGINDVKEILMNKDKHTFFFGDTNISGKKLTLKRLVLLGRITKLGGDVALLLQRIKTE